MQQITLNVDDEVKSLGDAIGGLIADLKAGKTALQDVEDVFQALVGAMATIQNVGVDIQKADNQVYLVKVLASAFEAAPAAAPAAPAAPVA